MSRRGRFIYEAARLQAIAAGAPVVPEPYELRAERDPAFIRQFERTVARQCSPARVENPEQLHDEWVRAYEAMGWRYGPVRDFEAKTHPDMVPYDQLDPRERDKDAVFVALCEIARQWIPEGE